MPADPARRCLLSGLAALAWLALPVRAENKAVMLPAFAYPDALPALLAAAGKAGVAVDTKQRPANRRESQAGDALTFLVSLRDGETLKQWILVAETADLTEKEAQLPPLKGFHAFSSTGLEVNLGGRRTAIAMTLIGPVTKRQADQGAVNPEVKRRRLLVNADYLRLGFDAACESALVLRAAGAESPGGAARFQPRLATKPFPEETAKANAPLALQVGFTPERERAYYGMVPVLLEFVNLIVKTPGLQDILKEVIDVSWWSVLSSGGKAKPHIQVIGRLVQKFDLGAETTLQQYGFPFVLEVNDKPAMASILIVCEPWAPMATTGGVIGIQAGRPFDKEPQLTVRLIATRCLDAAPPRLEAAPAGND